MRRAIIVPEKCQKCGMCNISKNCSQPNIIIRESPEDQPWIDFYKCRGCMKCQVYCEFGAVEELTQPCDGTKRMSW